MQAIASTCSGTSYRQPLPPTIAEEITSKLSRLKNARSLARRVLSALNARARHGVVSQDGTTGPDSLGVGYATDREDL